MNKIQKNDFFRKYRILEDNFNKTNLKWTDLLESSLSSYLGNVLISPSTFNIGQSISQFVLNNSERFNNLQDVSNTNILNNTLQIWCKVLRSFLCI